jgi:23S rRNA (cytosine1962-C5)-methyltransferase
MSTEIFNRLKKNHKKLISWSKQAQVEAFRLYDKDIPSYPYQIDHYGEEHLIVYDKGKRLHDAQDEQIADTHKEETLSALKELFPKATVFFKERKVIKERQEQYQRKSYIPKRFQVREGKLLFWVDLENYLDTGLFLDHRPLRTLLTKQSQGKRVLNLFAYTGSLSVAAAVGGGVCTTIDMSNTYLDWALENFKLNQLDGSQHQFIKADILQWLAEETSEQFDTIILDPPTFSNSKSMEQSLDTQRDHSFIIKACMKRLSSGGVLYFSTNYHHFKLDPSLEDQYRISDISKKMLPKDFSAKTKRFCYSIQSP